MHLSHKIRIYPSPEQEQLFREACGTARFAYNWALAQWNSQYEEAKKIGANPKINDGKLRKQLNAIKKEEFPWMSKIPKGVPQIAIQNLGIAFARFFQKTSKYPTFKKKGRHESFRADNAEAKNVSISGNYVKLPVFGSVRMAQKIRFQGKLVETTVTCKADLWFISFVFEVTQEEIDKKLEEKKQRKAKREVDKVDFLNSLTKQSSTENQSVIGADLGITNLVTLSNGKKEPALQPLKRELKKLARLQRKMAKCTKGSNRRYKARRKVARLHYRIFCIRQNVLHNLTTYLTQNFKVIVIEDLNVSGMLKNHCLARAIADVGFGEFKRQLEYKAELYGCQIILTDRWFPSSKLCSECGFKMDKLPLDIREWDCPDCGCIHDRDENAAKNLELYGIYVIATGTWPESNARGELTSTYTEMVKQANSLKREFQWKDHPQKESLVSL